MKRNWIRQIVRGLSFTSVMFIFQACYGTPDDIGLDVFIEGHVTSKTTGLPIEGIKVSVPVTMQSMLTDGVGNFSFYTDLRDSIQLQFEDIDSIQGGHYMNMDTVLTNLSEEVFLDINLTDK